MRNKLLLVLLVASALISSLAWADPSPGTRITTGNWQQYKDSMPLGMQELFAGKYAWKMPSDAVMEVTAPVPIHLPAKYFQDTEKYSGQVKMAAVDGGGFVLKDYVAGMPFPKPSGPERGEQILFDAWYRYQPWVMTGRVGNAEIDSYGNITNTVVGEINFKFRHISDVGLPPFYPGADDMFTVANLEVLQPEQSKYTTNLVIVPDNLTEDQQNYVFLPSLRRSLRLSTAARCSPLVGGDYTPDDINLLNIQIPEFTYRWATAKS
jgi:hypothetical protein